MKPRNTATIASDRPAPLSRSAQRALESAKRKAAEQQKFLLILLAIALIVNLIAAYVLYQALVVSEQQDNLQQMTRNLVHSRQNALENYLQAQQRQVDRLAAEKVWLANLDPATSAEARQEVVEVMTARYEDVLHIRLTPRDAAQLDRSAAFPLRYLELDLIHRAEQRIAALPELIQLNDRWMIQWVRPLAVDDQTPPAGTLLITTDATAMLSLLSSQDNSLGETLLQQHFAGTPPLTVLKLGKGDGGGPRTSVDIKDSHLVLQFTPSLRLIAQAEELPSFWLLVVSLIAASSLALCWFLSKLLSGVQETAEQPAGLATADLPKANKGTTTEDSNLINPLFQNQDILDIAVINEDEDILGLSGTSGKKSRSTTPARDWETEVPLEIFRSYDIRGLVDSQITPQLAQLLGQAIGSEALDQGEQAIVVARDGRTHSEALTTALIKGILRTGCQVINIGVVPTPVMYFSTFHLEETNSGVMVTASHNPKEYNGFKVVMNNRALADDAVLALRERIVNQAFHQGMGEEVSRAIIPAYIERIFSDVALAGNIHIVVDAGNAVPGLIAPSLFEELGCEVTQLFCELDGEFPNHNPDPTIEHNLHALIEKVQEVNADVGVAFDGDGDRLVVVTRKGDIIWPDRLLMLFAKDILARNPGADVLFDVKCSRQLNQLISSYGGRPIMWKTGHSPMKAKMEETQALIGGEYSGHIFIKDRWYGFDDGIYAMARLLEIITLRDQSLDDIFAGFPQLYATPEIKITVRDQDKFKLIHTLATQGDFANGAVTTIDGLRVDYTKGWGLVRASNTSPALTLRFEAESPDALTKIQQIFKRELTKVDANLTLNF